VSSASFAGAVECPDGPAGGGRWGDLLGSGQLGLDGVGGGVVQVGEDGQGTVPGDAGGIGLTGGGVDVAEAGQGGGFLAPVADIAKQGQGVFVAAGGLGVVIEVVMDVAEAVPGGGLPVAIVELLVQREGLLTGGESLGVVAELDVDPAEIVERDRLAAAVAGGPVPAEGLLGVVTCLIGPVLLAQATEEKVDAGLGASSASDRRVPARGFGGEAGRGRSRSTGFPYAGRRSCR
jgi:hypothetical protein